MKKESSLRVFICKKRLRYSFRSSSYEFTDTCLLRAYILVHGNNQFHVTVSHFFITRNLQRGNEIIDQWQNQTWSYRNESSRCDHLQCLQWLSPGHWFHHTFYTKKCFSRVGLVTAKFGPLKLSWTRRTFSIKVFVWLFLILTLAFIHGKHFFM